MSAPRCSALHLAALAHAAVDGHGREAGGLGERHERVVHLRGELAGREQHEGARAAAAGATALGREARDERERERDGLAAAGTAAAEDVATREGVGQRRGLDRERRGDALRGEDVDEVLRDAEDGEVGRGRRLRLGGRGDGGRRVGQPGARVRALGAVGAAARPVAARVVTSVRGDGHGTFRVVVVTRMTARSTLERSEGARDASSVTVVRSRAGAPQPVTGPEARGAALLERVPVVRRDSPRGQCHPVLGEMCPGYRSSKDSPTTRRSAASRAL